MDDKTFHSYEDIGKAYADFGVTSNLGNISELIKTYICQPGGEHHGMVCLLSHIANMLSRHIADQEDAEDEINTAISVGHDEFVVALSGFATRVGEPPYLSCRALSALRRGGCILATGVIRWDRVTKDKISHVWRCGAKTIDEIMAAKREVMGPKGEES